MWKNNETDILSDKDKERLKISIKMNSKLNGCVFLEACLSCKNNKDNILCKDCFIGGGILVPSNYDSIFKN